MSGPYGRRGYVEGLAGKDDVVADLWGGHVLIRPIPGGGVDAASAYPMGGFAPVRDLDVGLDGLRAAGVVSLTVVGPAVALAGGSRSRRARAPRVSSDLSHDYIKSRYILYTFQP